MLYYIFGAIAIFLFGFLVGRNNPNLAAVNDLIAKGKAVVDKTGAVVAAVNKAV